MTYAICEYCKKEMNPGTSCVFTHYKLSDGRIARRDTSNLGDQDICHDCNAPLGGFHHAGCDNERCPFCGQQALGCDCLEKAILLYYTPKESIDEVKS